MNTDTQSYLKLSRSHYNQTSSRSIKGKLCLIYLQKCSLYATLKRFWTARETCRPGKNMAFKPKSKTGKEAVVLSPKALETCIIKLKKIACKSLKERGVNSGLRLIYAYFSDEQKITFIELYHKNEKESEDRNRTTENFK